MAVKNPLALYNGKIKELQPGDTVPGGGGGVSIKQVTMDFGDEGRTFSSMMVHDPTVSPWSLVVASLAFDGPEGALPLIILGCGNMEFGRFTIYAQTADNRPFSGSIRINYINSTGVDGG
jgi:hypothetical protein